MPVVLTVTSAHQSAQAETLATDLALPFMADFKAAMLASERFVLVLTEKFLGLQACEQEKWAPFYIDFLSPRMQYRAAQASLRKECLARAIGISPQKKPMIVDATAGLGRDSFILAALGYQVYMCERSLILYALLQDALRRAAQHPLTKSIIQGMQLIYADARNWLEQAPAPDVVILDPMFPPRRKAAAVKKEMQLLQNLVGLDEDKEALLHQALTCATYRVVVKRPRLAAQDGKAMAPSFSLYGTTSRFDIYSRR